MNTSRREFLQGLSVYITLTLADNTVGFSNSFKPIHALNTLNNTHQVIIMNDKAIFNSSANSLLSTYQPPRNISSSTKRYTEKLNQQEFLSRHWFV